jgi:hypothetical protein
MDASKKDFKTPSSAPFSAGYSGAKSTATGGGDKKSLGTTIKNKATSIGTGAKTVSMQALPFTPFGFAITTAKAIENQRRKKRAKGEFFLSKKKELPITRDFYKLTGRPLDTKIGSADEPYMKAAGIIGFKKPIIGDNAGPKTVLCPDGTLPPCKPTTTTPDALPKNKFLADFKAYNSGGVSKGPPPKRGPNPQVPPVKMKDGKMSKKYKMSCPHRPDGIRGVGASIRGHKFIGVK